MNYLLIYLDLELLHFHRNLSLLQSFGELLLLILLIPVICIGQGVKFENTTFYQSGNTNDSRNQNIFDKDCRLRNPKLTGIQNSKSAINEFTQNQCCLIEITNEIINPTTMPLNPAAVTVNNKSVMFDEDMPFSSKVVLVICWSECLKSTISFVSVKYANVSKA